MKKLLITALIFMVGASFNTADAAKKKDKKGDKNVATVVVTPINANDSLSYAAGMASTEGLLTFIQQQYDVDTAYIADFVRGFNETMEKGMNSEFKAYNAGVQIAQMVMQRIFPSMSERLEGVTDSISNEMFNNGFVAAVQNKGLMADSVAKSIFENAIEKSKQIKEEAAKKEGADFLAENAKKEGVVTLPSGLQYKVLTKGEGKIPTMDDEVTVKYEGRLIDGTVFDSSYKRNPDTTKFRPNQVIKGWTEALTMMPVGSKWELYIPYDLAYGERQAGQIPPFSTLIFTVELVEF